MALRRSKVRLAASIREATRSVSVPACTGAFRGVSELADVLEVLRTDINDEMLPKGRAGLFRLANGFAIRHNNRGQMQLCDDAVWLR